MNSVTYEHEEVGQDSFLPDLLNKCDQKTIFEEKLIGNTSDSQVEVLSGNIL